MKNRSRERGNGFGAKGRKGKLNGEGHYNHIIVLISGFMRKEEGDSTRTIQERSGCKGG